MRSRLTLVVLLVCSVAGAAVADATLDLQAGTLTIDSKGYTHLQMAGDGNPWPTSPQPILRVDTARQRLLPETVSVEAGRLRASFPGGGVCQIAVRPGNGFAVFELTRLEFASPVERIELFSVALPNGTEVTEMLNAGSTPAHVVAVSAAEPNVRAFSQTAGRQDSDKPGCSHELTRTDQAKAGANAAHFTATCDAQPGGWSYCGCQLSQPVNLTGLKAIRAWVNGDGKGELLKVQLYDGVDGYRDTHIPINFEGWQQVTVAKGDVNTLRLSRVTALNLYYNGLPASHTVTCSVDQIEAILDRDGKETNLLLEDFEPGSSFWNVSATTLNVETSSQHGLQPARFGVIASSREKFIETMQRFEEAAGLPCSKPGGVWNKLSPWIERSYLFITSFKDSQFDSVLALARRGGFDMILMGQESWAKATGHYDINTENFPGGLDALVRTFQRFKQEGFHIGLHFLGPSIYPPDPYLTPVPDARLVRDAAANLASDIDEKANVLPTEAAPSTFPPEDGGYMGDGTIVQIENELISYDVRATDAPFGFRGCKRGILGTAAAPHAKGSPIRHLQRSYGYFLFDMDTSLIDEVSSNFAKVANACDIDMIYFDGSERLQGDHWYYNARLHKAFFDKLARKDILIQASSFSHYSWHILARTASADGHGDLKGYLDERSGGFGGLKHAAMPLDIGWYYGYDTSCTPDMYEYILGATIGYDSSMSFQVSLDAASKHPFTGEILDLIARYERLRLSGRVPEDMRERLRIDPALAGEKSPEERAKLLDLRREYRLLAKDGNDSFQRVIYEPWHELASGDKWPVRVKEGPVRVGVQIHVQSGPWLDVGPSYRAKAAVMLESFDDLAPYLKDRQGRNDVKDISDGEAGATLEGVSQHIGINEQDTKEGGRCLLYSADSRLNASTGWSVFGKSFDPPLDLSAHKAIGFWLRGDGKGGAFKLQLLDGAKAADFYVTNDYTGWRYQQLPRPQPDPIDYSHVRTLNFYYNGLPANKSVTCAVDDVKALPAADVQTLADPWVDVGGQRFEWKGELSAGQYLFLWPGESSKRYGPAFTEPVTSGEAVPAIALPEGEHTIQFGHAGVLASPARVRVTLQPPEIHQIP